jgi:nucleotide-binding universal stress UspA family protein
MPPIRKILCPVDFSEGSERAVAYAASLARQLGASIELVHVWASPVYAFPDGALILGAEAVDRLTTDLRGQLDACVARHADRDLLVAGRLVQGDSPREIVAVAKAIDADLVVMGTHGRTGLARALVGSVAERVVRTSPVPVLTVPPERRSEEGGSHVAGRP